MKIEQFTENLLKSEFAFKNFYMHMYLGFPIPIIYNNQFAIKFFLHQIRSEKSSINFSEPKFEIILLYPSGRILKYSDCKFDQAKQYEVEIKENVIPNFKYSYIHLNCVCNEVLDFYDKHKKMNSTVLKNYFSALNSIAATLKIEGWYEN